MIENRVPNYLSISFNQQDVPIDYIWSGYTKTKEEFYQNFLFVKSSGDDVLVCSEQNIVALADYLSNFFLNNPIIYNTEEYDSPDMSIWFLYGWEVVVIGVDGLPEWMQEIIRLLVVEQIIIISDIDGTKYYCIPNYYQYEDGMIPSQIMSKIEQICNRYLVESHNWKETEEY